MLALGTDYLFDSPIQRSGIEAGILGAGVGGPCVSQIDAERYASSSDCQEPPSP